MNSKLFEFLLDQKKFSTEENEFVKWTSALKRLTKKLAVLMGAAEGDQLETDIDELLAFEKNIADVSNFVKIYSFYNPKIFI